jgi:arsenite methyltransferase
MSKFLSYKFEDTPEFVSTFDEMPLWSAYFGIFLLKHLKPQPNITILDIGSGAGFPLLEIAGRFGSSCTCYGLDPWTNANERARKKILNYALSNVTIIEGSAAAIPLKAESVDLVVSNLGINNFENPEFMFAECYRVLKKDGKLAITTNLNGHWQEFYNIFDLTLIELGLSEVIIKLNEQQQHRGTVESIHRLYEGRGFIVNRHSSEMFDMNFTDGSAFLNHYFIKLGWLQSWKDLMSPEDHERVFVNLETRLNKCAYENDGLRLTVPILFIEGIKA